MGPAGTAPDSLQLAILGESSTRSEDDIVSNTWCESEDMWDHSICQYSRKPGDHPKGVKRPFSEGGSNPGYSLGGSRSSENNSQNPILGMASHDLCNVKTTILGAAPGAIPGIDGNPHGRFSKKHAFSECFFKSWGCPRAQDTWTPRVKIFPKKSSDIFRTFEWPTHKPRHASVFRMHSDMQAVLAFHCTRMFKRIFSTRVLLKRTETLASNA